MGRTNKGQQAKPAQGSWWGTHRWVEGVAAAIHQGTSSRRCVTREAEARGRPGRGDKTTDTVETQIGPRKAPPVGEWKVGRWGPPSWRRSQW